MLTPEYLDHVGDELLALYSKLDESILRDITRRLVKSGNVTATAQRQIWRAQESGLLYDDIIAEVAKLSSASDAQVRALFEDAGAVSVSYDNRIYEAAGLTPLPIKASPSAMQALNAGIEKTAGHLNNLTLTTASTAQQVFIQAATLAEMQVENGAFDYVTAVRNAVREASKESKWISYPSGHRDRIDVAMRRAVLTGVSQTTGQISMFYAQDMGCDLMEITAHAGARPSHAVWQGQIVSLSGRSGYLSLSDIGYGTGAGFKGWNCRHDWYPFFEGLSESAYPRREIEAYKNATVRYDGRTIPLYDATQMQRAMEREIRDTKRILAGLDAGIEETSDETLKAALKQDFTAKSALLKRQEAALKEFLRETGLLNDSSRVQIYGFGHSQASKAVWTVKKNTLTNAAGQTIIKVECVKIEGTPNSITQKTNKKGGIDRNYYGPDGKQTKQISNNGHGHAKEEAIGQHGEHAHDYIWDQDGNLTRDNARELTEQERIDNEDFLYGETDQR